MRRKHIDAAAQLARVKLNIERARLAKLQAQVDALPKSTPQYTRYEDIPPPSPEDRARFMVRLEKLYSDVLEEGDLLEGDLQEADIAFENIISPRGSD